MTFAALWVSVGIGACTYADGPAKPPMVPIVGTVVDAGRRPAGGVEVSFSHFKNDGVAGGGEVVARTSTDAQGRFRLEVPGAPGGGPEPGLLWAYRPGSLVAWYRVNRETVPPDWPIAMVLDHPARGEFLVRGPDGKPVAGARIHPRVLRSEPRSIPGALSDRIAEGTVTDARGRAVLTAVFPEELSTAFVSAPGLGRQYVSFGDRGGQQKDKAIDLKPVGRVEGRIVADDPGLARNRKLAIVIWDRDRGAPAIGLEDATTDDQGRFTLPEVPVGSLGVHANPLPGSPWFLSSVAGTSVEAGRTVRVRVDVKAYEGVRLRGTVRERGTGKPIAGAGVSLYGSGGREDEAVRTDAGGRFTLFAPAGSEPGLTVSPPGEFAYPMFGLDFPRVPGSVAEFNLPPIELNRARAVTGVVVDARGEPVPGAIVLASYPVDEGPNAQGRRDRRAVAGPRGEFRIDRVVADVPVGLAAILPDGRRTHLVAESKAGAAPARLVVEPSDSVSLAGRVVDASGHRVAGASVHLRVQEHYAGGPVKGDALVEIRRAYTIKTNDDGWFRTPPILDPEGEYAALAEADGYEPARTAWTHGKSRTFPELVLRPRAGRGLAVVEGSVVDRDGRPVAGAAVRIATDPGQEIRATADPGGRFRLEGVRPGRAFFFVEADGFRFLGRMIDPGADTGPVAIELTRHDQRPKATMATLPPPLSRDEMRALARRVFVPHAERVLKEGRPGFRSQVLTSLARIDPGRTIQIIENDIALGEADGPIRLECARALWQRDPDAVIAVVDASAGARWRASGLLKIGGWLPESDRPARLELADRALAQARLIPDVEEKVRLLGEVAERYLDLGETAKGTEVLRAALPAARGLPDTRDGRATRHAFADVLDHVAPADAAELVRGHAAWLQEVGDRLHHAARLAERDPAHLEASLASVLDPRWLPTLCLAMARKDPDRARRLADHRLGRGNVAPFARPYAIGMIAQALADTDKPRATRMLHEAFAVLDRLKAEGRRGGLDAQDPATVAAALLPVAERIDPSLVPEFFWRAVSFRVPSRPRRDFEARPEAVLAMLLARYDREAARLVLDPLLHREPDPQDTIVADVAQALAAIDPARAVAFVEALPETPGVGIHPVRFTNDNARLELATFLADPPDRCWPRLVSRHLDLSIAGDEEGP